MTSLARRADTQLTGSNPGRGARVAVAPTRTTLTFDEPVDPDLVVIFTTGADGVSWPGSEITARRVTPS